MRNKQILFWLIVAIFVLTVVLTVIHLTGRETVAQGALLVKTGDKTYTVTERDLAFIPVEGTVVNGKGEEKQISGEGVALRALLEQVGVQPGQVTVYADDEYSAVISAEELIGEDHVWLLRTDGGYRLIIFGDKNSKRDVKNVKRIEVQ